MKQLLESAVSRLEIDTDSLVAGGAARGRVRRRRRRLLAGVGSAAAVGMVATGAVLLPGLGTGEIAQEADFADPAGSAAVVQDQRLLSLQQVLDGLRSDSAAAAPTAPDVPLAMHNDAIRDQLASMLSVGEVGPISPGSRTLTTPSRTRAPISVGCSSPTTAPRLSSSSCLRTRVVARRGCPRRGRTPRAPTAPARQWGRRPW